MFYGEKLYEIREMFSYSRKDLAKQLGLNEQQVWQFETNQVVPDFSVINNLKKLFHVQASFFLEESFIQKESHARNIAYRKKNEASRAGVKSEEMYLNFFYTHIQEVEEIVFPSKGTIHAACKEIEGRYNLTDLSLLDLKEIAAEARSTLGMLTNWRLMYYLELSGIYIVERDLKEEVDAYSSWISHDSYPVIVLNKSKNSAVRRNFDLAHELGHLLLHRYVDFDDLDKKELSKIEREANLFSSYFTLPEEELKRDFFKLSDPTNPQTYVDLKKKYRMSIQAIAYRASHEGWLSKEENRHFWKRMNYHNYRCIEPLDRKLPVHTPGKIHALLLKAIETNTELVQIWREKYAVDNEYLEEIFGVKDDLLKQSKEKEQENYLLLDKVQKNRWL